MAGNIAVIEARKWKYSWGGRYPSYRERYIPLFWIDRIEDQEKIK